MSEDTNYGGNTYMRPITAVSFLNRMATILKMWLPDQHHQRHLKTC